MTTGIATRASVRATFSQLIDYAGLFPPAKLAMEPSLREYVAAREAGYSWMLGRFIVPLSRTGELLENLGDAKIALSVIVDAGTDARTWFADATLAFERLDAVRLGEALQVSIASLEVPLPALASARDTYEAAIGQLAALRARFGFDDVPTFVETPRDARYAELLENTMTALVRYGLSGKVRCGGVEASMYPTPAELAAFVVAAHAAGAAFKATAGLHHPVRHYNEGAKATMHGFLNLLCATLFASEGAPAVEAILAEEDPSAFVFEDDALRFRTRRASVTEIETMRSHGFAGYGSCSFDEPVKDLTALHILPKSE